MSFNGTKESGMLSLWISMRNAIRVDGWVPAIWRGGGGGGGGMVSWIFTMKATEEVRTSVIPLTQQQDLNNDDVRLKVKEFDKKLIDKLKKRAEPLPTDQEEAIST